MVVVVGRGGVRYHREAVTLDPGRDKLTDIAAFDHTGTLTLATGTIADRANRRLEKVSGEQYVDVSRQRRQRRFGPRGEMEVYGPGAARPAAQRRIDASAALRLQRMWRLRRLGKLKGDGIGSATDSLLHAQRAKCGGAGGCCVVM